MDIFRETDPVTLTGEQWYRVESDAQGNVFRWAGEDVGFTIIQPPGVSLVIRLDVEPGPAVGLKPFSLIVVEDGQNVPVSLPIVGRTRVEFLVPLGVGGYRHFTLRAENRSTPVPAPGDKRALVFRLFALSVAGVSKDALFANRDVEAAEQRVALEEEMRVLRAERDDLDQQLHALSVRSLAMELQLAEVPIQRAELEKQIAATKRELEVRDGVIERLEAVAARARSEADQARRSADEKEAVIQQLSILAEERLDVIRTLHEERQRA